MNEPVTQHLIDSTLRLCITDTDVLLLLQSYKLPPNFFQPMICRSVFDICSNYYRAYKTAPGDHFQDELAKTLVQLKPTDRQEELVLYVDRLSSMSQPDKQYVLSRVQDLIKSRAMTTAALTIAESVEQGNFAKAKLAMHKALETEMLSDSKGLDYFNDLSLISQRDEYSITSVPIGLKNIDRKLSGGLVKPMFVMLLGKMKGRKTWMLAHLGKQALFQGLDVAHVSFEMSLRQMDVRYDRLLAGLNKTTEDAEIECTFLDIENHRLDTITQVRPGITNYQHIQKARRAMRRFGGRLFIKKYPMGGASILDVETYLDYLERFEGVTPDVLITDYADIMAPIDGREELRNQISETYINHKRLADERNMLVITASQSNRAGLSRSRFAMKDVAEDIRKMAHVDLAFGLTQAVQSSKSLDIMRMVVMAGREIEDVGVETMFGTNLDMGQLIAWEASPTELDELLAIDEEEEEKEDE